MLPRFPPQNVGRPDAEHSAPVSAVVVDLPLVPVIASSWAPGCKQRYASSISAMTSTPAARAATISGKVGTPGDITTRSAPVNDARSWPPSCHCTGTSSSCAIRSPSCAAGLPSVTITDAPCRWQNLATAIPV
jgi:hypothetical protein